ncbi:MAG: OmpA family protein [Nitrospira sp.]
MLFWILDSAIDAFLFQKHTFSEQLLTPNGMEIYFRLALGGLLVALVCLRVEITRQKLAEEKARFQKGFYENLINSSIDGILAFDSECRYTLWNATMERITGIKKKNVLGKTQNEIHVVGHTDNFPIRSTLFQTNWELSVIRASRVARYLIEAGDLEPGRFSVLGHSMYRPVAPNTTEENKQKNRRVEIIITRDNYTVNPTR